MRSTPIFTRVETKNREIQVDVPSAATATQQQLPRQSYQPIIEEHAYKQTTTKRQIDNEFQNDGDYESGKVFCFS